MPVTRSHTKRKRSSTNQASVSDVQVPPAENLTVDQMKDILFEAGIRFSMTIRRPALCQLYNQQFFSTKVQKMTHDHHSDVRSDRRALAGVTGDTGGDTIARRRMRGILPPTRDEGKYYTRTNDELLRLLEPFGLDDQRMTHEDLVKLCRLYHHKIASYDYGPLELSRTLIVGPSVPNAVVSGTRGTSLDCETDTIMDYSKPLPRPVQTDLHSLRPIKPLRAVNTRRTYTRSDRSLGTDAKSMPASSTLLCRSLRQDPDKDLSPLEGPSSNQDRVVPDLNPDQNDLLPEIPLHLPKPKLDRGTSGLRRSSRIQSITSESFPSGLSQPREVPQDHKDENGALHQNQKSGHMYDCVPRAETPVEMLLQSSSIEEATVATPERCVEEGDQKIESVEVAEVERKTAEAQHVEQEESYLNSEAERATPEGSIQMAVEISDRSERRKAEKCQQERFRNENAMFSEEVTKTSQALPLIKSVNRPVDRPPPSSMPANGSASPTHDEAQPEPVVSRGISAGQSTISHSSPPVLLAADINSLGSKYKNSRAILAENHSPVLEPISSVSQRFIGVVIPALNDQLAERRLSLQKVKVDHGTSVVRSSQNQSIIISPTLQDLSPLHGPPSNREKPASKKVSCANEDQSGSVPPELSRVQPVIPSLEKGIFLHRRPRPTVLHPAESHIKRLDQTVDNERPDDLDYEPEEERESSDEAFDEISSSDLSEEPVAQPKKTKARAVKRPSKHSRKQVAPLIQSSSNADEDFVEKPRNHKARIKKMAPERGKPKKTRRATRVPDNTKTRAAELKRKINESRFSGITSSDPESEDEPDLFGQEIIGYSGKGKGRASEPQSQFTVQRTIDNQSTLDNLPNPESVQNNAHASGNSVHFIDQSNSSHSMILEDAASHTPAEPLNLSPAEERVSPTASPIQNPNNTYDDDRLQSLAVRVRALERDVAMLKSSDANKDRQLASYKREMDDLRTTQRKIAPSARYRRPHDNLEDDVISNQEDALTDETPLRRGHVAKLVRTHIKTLFGLKKTEKILPNAATPAQRSQWRRLTLPELLEGPADGSELQNHAPNTDDPHFPYVGGPGGEDVAPQSVKSKDNMFLWNFAAATFVKLVECGEYKGVTANDAKPANILEKIICYAQNTLSRNYREERNLTLQQRQIKEKRHLRLIRCNQLKYSRSDFILSNPILLPLIPILDKCCSDDETDTETTSSPKVCKVRRFDWRSAALEDIFIKIDEGRKTRKESSPKGTPGVAPRQRRRDQDNPINPMDAPAGLPIDCYDHAWLYSPDPQKPRIEVLEDRPLARITHALSQI